MDGMPPPAKRAELKSWDDVSQERAVSGTLYPGWKKDIDF